MEGMPHTQNGHYLREDVELTIGDYDTASRRGLDALNTFIQGRTKLLAEIVQVWLISLCISCAPA